jgi:hypothetical protein
MIDLVVSVEIWLGIETFWECHKSVIFVRHSIILPICTVDVETQALRQLKINHNLLSINVHYNRCAYLTHQREEGNLRPRRWGNPQTSGPGGKPADLRGNSQPQEKSSAAGEGKPSTTGGGPSEHRGRETLHHRGNPQATGEILSPSLCDMRTRTPINWIILKVLVTTALLVEVVRVVTCIMNL